MQTNKVGAAGDSPMYGQTGQPMTTQPSGAGAPATYNDPTQEELTWMQRPTPISGSPPGLEYLAHMDQLMVRQQKDPVEMLTRAICVTRFKIVNPQGQQVYFALEESDHGLRQFRGSTRPFVLHITDNTGQEVIRVHRADKSRCAAACCGCTENCSSEMTVEAPPGQLVGRIKQLSGMPPNFSLMDDYGTEKLIIHGPEGCCSCCFGCCPNCVKNLDFQILQDGGEVGHIKKEWNTYQQQVFTSADDFLLSFPRSLEVKMKATIIAATVLLNFLYFERIQPKARRNTRMANTMVMRHLQQQEMMQQQHQLQQQQQGHVFQQQTYGR